MPSLMSEAGTLKIFSSKQTRDIVFSLENGRGGIWQRLARWSNKVWRVPTAGGRRYFRGLFVIHVIVPESTPPPYCSHLNETSVSLH